MTFNLCLCPKPSLFSHTPPPRQVASVRISDGQRFFYTFIEPFAGASMISTEEKKTLGGSLWDVRIKSFFPKFLREHPPLNHFLNQFCLQLTFCPKFCLIPGLKEENTKVWPQNVFAQSLVESLWKQKRVLVIFSKEGNGIPSIDFTSHRKSVNRNKVLDLSFGDKVSDPSKWKGVSEEWVSAIIISQWNNFGFSKILTSKQACVCFGNKVDDSPGWKPWLQEQLSIFHTWERHNFSFDRSIVISQQESCSFFWRPGEWPKKMERSSSTIAFRQSYVSEEQFWIQQKKSENNVNFNNYVVLSFGDQVSDPSKWKALLQQ